MIHVSLQNLIQITASLCASYKLVSSYKCVCTGEYYLKDNLLTHTQHLPLTLLFKACALLRVDNECRRDTSPLSLFPLVTAAGRGLAKIIWAHVQIYMQIQDSTLPKHPPPPTHTHTHTHTCTHTHTHTHTLTLNSLVQSLCSTAGCQ